MIETVINQAQTVYTGMFSYNVHKSGIPLLNVVLFCFVECTGTNIT